MKSIRQWGPGLILVAPSIVLIGVFVYGLIGWNFVTSLKRQPVGADPPSGLGNYTELFDEPRWRQDLEHLLLFTVVFIVGSLVMGLIMALLLDKGVKGEGFFRSIYLFPMAVSFIASGIVWRWLLNPSSGLNLIFDKVGLGVLKNDWWQSRSWGMAAMAMPAIWQISGYIMALYLAGLRGVPEELREAARIDGASEFQLYRHVIFPHITPITLSALVILGHISIKVFDLILAVSGKQLITETPAVYMWDLIFQARNEPKGAAIAAILLLGVAVLVIPYLIYVVRSERKDA